MTIDELKAKLEASKLKVEKIKKTIERHENQMAKKAKSLKDLGVDPESSDKYKYAQQNDEKSREIYWLLCDYETKKDDIKGSTKKLSEAERIRDNWSEKLDFEINKEKIIQDTAPKVIKDFLEDWKQKSFEWHVKRHADFLRFRHKLRAEERLSRLEAFNTFPEYEKARERFIEIYGNNEPDDSYLVNLWPRKPMEEFLKERRLDYKEIRKRLSDFAGQVVLKMCEFKNESDRLTWLDHYLEGEKKAKLFNLITQINFITGPITDAQYLYISGGDINGVLLGEKGAAQVQSYSAGGWNIQCFHFRTRVDDVSERFKNGVSLDDVISLSKEMSEKSAADTNNKEDINREI